MRIADTSALLALFLEDDAHRRQARAAFADPSTIVIPAEILTEFLILLRRRQGSERASAAGNVLWSLPHTEIQPSDTAILMEAWGEFEAAHRRLSFPDCIVLAWCRRHGARPLAYDKALLRAARR